MYQPHLLAALRLGWGRGHYALVSRTLWLRKGGKERVHEKKSHPEDPPYTLVEALPVPSRLCP